MSPPPKKLATIQSIGETDGVVLTAFGGSVEAPASESASFNSNACGVEEGILSSKSALVHVPRARSRARRGLLGTTGSIPITFSQPVILRLSILCNRARSAYTASSWMSKGSSGMTAASPTGC